MGCKDQGCFDICWFLATLNLSHALITGAIIPFLVWELSWVELERSQDGHKGFSTDAHYIYSPFITSLDVFFFFFLLIQPIRTSFCLLSESRSRKSPTVLFPRRVLFLFFSSFLSLVMAEVYDSEGHIPKMNSLLAEKEKECYSEADSGW